MFNSVTPYTCCTAQHQCGTVSSFSQSTAHKSELVRSSPTSAVLHFSFTLHHVIPVILHLNIPWQIVSNCIPLSSANTEIHLYICPYIYTYINIYTHIYSLVVCVFDMSHFICVCTCVAVHFCEMAKQEPCCSYISVQFVPDLKLKFHFQVVNCLPLRPLAHSELKFKLA